MPRRTSSPTMLIVNFFMSAPLAEAKQALDTARAIVSSREATGLQQPSLPNAPKPRQRRARKPKQEALPGTTAAPAGTTGPVAVPDAPRARRRRGAGARPPVAETAATTAAAPLPPVPSGVDLASLPPPTE